MSVTKWPITKWLITKWPKRSDLSRSGPHGFARSIQDPTLSAYLPLCLFPSDMHWILCFCTATNFLWNRQEGSIQKNYLRLFTKAKKIPRYTSFKSLKTCIRTFGLRYAKNERRRNFVKTHRLDAIYIGHALGALYPLIRKFFCDTMRYDTMHVWYNGCVWYNICMI